jgi:hypothetical protein
LKDLSYVRGGGDREATFLYTEVINGIKNKCSFVL